MNITDETIKKKHKEFNNRIMIVLKGQQGGMASPQLSPAIQNLRQLRQLTQFRKPTLQRPMGS